MAVLHNHLEIYKLLPRTNCRRCDLATCLAFAVEVMQGRKLLKDCPLLPEDILADVRPKAEPKTTDTGDIQQAIRDLQGQVRKTDLATAARRLGLPYAQGRVTINCLGKDFLLGPDGLISSCHINPWIYMPILNYILSGAGVEPQSRWKTLRELEGGADWWNFFVHRCEKPLKQLIDNHSDLFEIIIDVFGGRPAPPEFDSDIAVLIHPLPRLPILFCHWRPDEGMDSALHLFFDSSADRNLKVEAIYILCTGLTTMFQKIVRTHG